MKDDDQEAAILRALQWIAIITFAGLMLALVAGCGVPPLMEPVEELTPIPPALQVCPDATPTPTPPPVPRTVEAVLAWGEKSAAASDANARALRTCRARLDKLNGWIGDGP